VHYTSEQPTYALLDLFAGCGGLTAGFVSVRDLPARFSPEAAVELDPDAAATYAANFGPHVHHCAIEDWLGTDIPQVDVVIGGPPCQGFSWLGKRQPADPRNKLWRYYAEVVAAARPTYFVIENVIPFLRSDQFHDLVHATRPGGPLEGYVIDESSGVARAIDFGAAQDRRRAVVIGRRHDAPPVDLEPWQSPSRTVRDAIGHLPSDVSTIELPRRTAAIEVANGSIVAPGVYTTRELHVSRRYEAISLARIAAIPPGGDRDAIPEHLLPRCWKRHTGGHRDVMGRLWWDKPSVTIRTEFWKPEKGRYLHPTANRALTHAEAALLQGFPEDYRWCGSKISIGRQIGNAVPVPLAQAIARAILTALVDGDIEPRRTQ